MEAPGARLAVGAGEQEGRDDGGGVGDAGDLGPEVLPLPPPERRVAPDLGPQGGGGQSSSGWIQKKDRSDCNQSKTGLSKITDYEDHGMNVGPNGVLGEARPLRRYFLVVHAAVSSHTPGRRGPL